MEMLKKNILSLVCGVVALLAIIALFYPVGGMYGDTLAELKKRVAVADNAQRLRRGQHFWPIIPDVKTGEKEPLPRFPNDDIIKTGKKIKDEVHAQTTNIKDKTAEKNQHDLLLPGVLPTPKDKGYDFATAYLKKVQVAFPHDLQGGAPPTDKEVDAAGTALWAAQFQAKEVVVNGAPINDAQVRADWALACAPLQNQLRKQVAESIKVYIDTDWISIQRNMPTTTNPPTEQDIWYAQNMIWIQGDVISAIKQINGSARDMTDSPIKHILRLEGRRRCLRNIFQPLEKTPRPSTGKKRTI